MPLRRISSAASSKTCAILRLTSTRSLRGAWRFTSERILPMISLARRPSAAMASSTRRVLAISGGSAASQRVHAAAFATIAPSGWFTSWAIAAVSSPIIVTRDTRASSSRTDCSAESLSRKVASASLRSLMSRASER
jgi:hypothetical protein